MEYVFFEEFGDHANANAKSLGRCFPGSRNRPLKDGRHDSKRKADLLLLPQEHIPKDSTDYSWKHVLVVGEFKCNHKNDMARGTIIQLAGCVRELFGAQPGRRFVYAFTVCRQLARLWLFDCTGVSAGGIIDIPTENGSRIFPTCNARIHDDVQVRFRALESRNWSLFRESVSDPQSSSPCICDCLPWYSMLENRDCGARKS